MIAGIIPGKTYLTALGIQTGGLIRIKMTTVTGATLDQLEWSDVEYRLSEFVDRFNLPQLVKVKEGFCGPEEDLCISAGQIIALHTIKTTEKVLVRDREGRELHMLLSCPQKIELRLQGKRNAYTMVRHLRNLKFVRAIQGYYGLDDGGSFDAGEKLEIIRVESGTGSKENYLLFRNENRSLFRLPFSATAEFQPLTDGREYYLKDVSGMKLPVYFQFIDPIKPIDKTKNVLNSSLGMLKLEKIYHSPTVICTITEGSARTIVACPKELPITVTVAQGAVEGDKDYMRLCHLFHDGVSLTKIGNMESENIYASPDACVYLPPPVPPRSSISEGSPSSLQSNTEDARRVVNRGNSALASANSGFEGSSPTKTTYQEEEKAESDIDENYYECIDENEIVTLSPRPADRSTTGFSRTCKPGSDRPSNQGEAIASFFAGANSSSNAASMSIRDHSVHSHPVASDEYEMLPNAPLEHAKNKQTDEVLKYPVLNKQETLPGPVAGPRKAPPLVKSKPRGLRISPSHKIAEMTNEKSTTPTQVKSPGKLPQPAVKQKLVTPGMLPAVDAGTTFDITRDLSQLSVGEVSKFLKKVHLEDFVDVFAENDVDGEFLVTMTAEDMRALEMNAFQCKKLLKLISGWRPKL